MKKKITLVALLLLTSCTSLDSLKKVNVDTNSFNGALAQGYLDYSNNQVKQYDWSSTPYYFAQKGLDAANGKDVAPEDKNAVSFNDDARTELDVAKNRLMAVLTSEVKNTFPKMAADAQVKYDCWVNNQNPSFVKTMDDSCRMDFMKLIGRLEDENEDNNEAIEQMPVYDHSTIYFNLDSARISHNDDMVIKDMAKKMMSDKDFKVVVKGYADLNGTEEYNDMISRKRAHHVAHYLKKHGVPCDKIVIHHFGSKHLAVAQAAGKVEPMNRRAEIELVK